MGAQRWASNRPQVTCHHNSATLGTRGVAPLLPWNSRYGPSYRRHWLEFARRMEK